MSSSISKDARLIIAAQALRAFAYGFGAVLIGVSLHARGFSNGQVGAVLAAIVAGTVAASVAVGRRGDRWGRRRCYMALYGFLAIAGVVFAASAAPWGLIVVALMGGLSTEVIESGPFTTLEQSMLATELSGERLVAGFGTYNAVAAAAGSCGALAAGGLGPLRKVWGSAPSDSRWFLVLVVAALAGLVVAAALSPHVETRQPASDRDTHPALSEARPVVRRLAGLFATDSFGGGFVVQAFVAYWLAERFDASVTVVGAVFFMVGIMQTVSFLVAPRLARRYGLLNTMVFTHLPSNLLLIAIAFAPTLGTAVVLLLARTVLSQMDVPTRQAYVMALVERDERTGAAAYTNTARYLTRPVGPLIAGSLTAVWVGAPFVIAGSVKATYDLVLWRWFRTIDLPTHDESVLEVTP